MFYHTSAIILKAEDFRESDRLFSIYTKDLGKIIAVSRGAKKIQSKLNSHLQFFAVVDLMVAFGRNFDQLAGANLIRDFSNLKKDFKKIILASFGLELVEQLTKPHYSESKIFNLLFSYLEAIDKKSVIEKKDWQNLKNQFIIKLFTLLGYKPKPEVIADPNKLEVFFKNHLDNELKSERLIDRLLSGKLT